MDNKNVYYVVEFPEEVDENGSFPVAIISISWAFHENQKDYCWWPNFKTDTARTNAAMKHVLVSPENGSMCEIRIKFRSDDYERAVRKLKYLETHSDNLESDASTLKRTRKKNDAFLPSKYKDFVAQNYDSDESNDLPIISDISKHKKNPLIQTNSQHVAEEIASKTGQIKGQISNAQFEIIDSNYFTCSTCAQLKVEAFKVGGWQRLSGNNTKGLQQFRVLAYEVALLLNWTGRNDKPPFSEFKKLIELICDAVKANPVCKTDYSEKVVHGAIKVWLRGACD